MKDKTIIAWLICDVLRDIFFIFGSVYLVIWKGCSGWWIVLAIILCQNDLLTEVLKKKHETN
jgi:hypothetical protein